MPTDIRLERLKARALDAQRIADGIAKIEGARADLNARYAKAFIKNNGTDASYLNQEDCREAMLIGLDAIISRLSQQLSVLLDGESAPEPLPEPEESKPTGD